MADGFLDDYRHFTPAEIARDPFYQEFLRPVGFGWHAVACLAAGDTVERAAEALAISPAHARQRLKIVFDKTDTHRQSELIALRHRLAEFATRG